MKRGVTHFDRLDIFKKELIFEFDSVSQRERREYKKYEFKDRKTLCC